MATLLSGMVTFIIATIPVSADMGLAPLRHVLDETTHRVVFVVSNPSDRIMEGQVSWIDLAATPTGYITATAEQRDLLSAAPYLTLSPAQFRLKPGARIDVVVSIKDGTRIPKGERRSHLLIQTDASRTAIRKASNSGLPVDVGLGVSAPVILRNGGKAKADITETKLYRDKQGMLALETSIDPDGNNSSFGRVRVVFTPSEAPERPQTLGIRENVNGFLDATHRQVSIPFGFVSLGSGELTVRYEGAGEYEGIVFDERAYDIEPPEQDDPTAPDSP